jgi:hypothetical protein
MYRIIILPVVLYGCETWSFTMREKRRVRVFENRVLRRIFWLKRDEVTGEWRKLYNDLNDLYSSPNVIRVIKSRIFKLAGHVARMGGRRGAYRVLVGESERRKPLGTPRRRLEDNIKMDLQELVWGNGLDLSGSGKGQVAGFCKGGNKEPSSRSIKCGEFLDYLKTGFLLKKDSAPWSE